MDREDDVEPRTEGGMRGGGAPICGLGRLLAVGLCLGVLIAGGYTSGCGGAQGPLDSGRHEVSVAPSAGSGTSDVPSTGPGPVTSMATGAGSSATVADPSTPADPVQVFEDMARATVPAPIYGLTEIPAGTTVPALWWPVLTLTTPSDYKGPPISNPRTGEGGPAVREVQLVLAVGDAWLVVLENFRGDLGEVVGNPVGNVAGHAATLYAMNGGTLVQWSDQGAWYGVFGRGLAPAAVVRMALDMVVIEPGH